MNKSDQHSFENILATGLELLREDLVNAELDRTGEKAEKYYFRRAQVNFLSRFKISDIMAEIYFQEMLNAIREFEQKEGKEIHKSWVYTNLGIAQMIHDKFDIGIANFLLGQSEHHKVDPSFDILERELWPQFEKSKVFDYLLTVANNPQITLGFNVDELFLTDLVRGMGQERRIFFESTIWSLQLNFELYKLHPNLYTRIVLYSGLRNLCLLIENLLRDKQQRQGSTIGPLLREALKTREFSKMKPLDQYKDATTLVEFADNLSSIIQSHVKDDETRWAYCLWLARNFTSHNLEPSETVSTKSGMQSFDKIFGDAVNNAVAALFHFKHVGIV